MGDQVWFDSRRRHPGARPVAYAASYGPDGEPFRAPTDDRNTLLEANGFETPACEPVRSGTTVKT